VRLRNSAKRSSATLAATAMLFAGLSAVALQPASAAPQVFELHADGIVNVPNDVNTVTLEIHGAAGGAGGQTGGSPGRGAVETIQVPVTPGQAISVGVGQHGGNAALAATNPAGGGGVSGGPGNGGNGGKGANGAFGTFGAAGGGGGGATAVYLDGNLLAVAGGGGGGGGTNALTSPGGNGGNADADGQPGSDIPNASGGENGDAPTAAGSPGEDATGAISGGGGAGGGGGGYEGGSGGAFTALVAGSSGGGGGGGDSYFDAAKATQISRTATEAGNGYVTFTYSQVFNTSVQFTNTPYDVTNRQQFGYTLHVNADGAQGTNPVKGTLELSAESQDDGTVYALGTKTLDANGNVKIFSNKLKAGDYILTGSYTPTGASVNDSKPSENTQSLTVTKGDTETFLTTDSTDIPNYGDDVKFNVSVNAEAPAQGTPTGKVQFFVDGSPVGPTVANGPVTLDSAGNATLTVQGLSVGAHDITATYAGDSEFNGSSANESDLQGFYVNQGDTTVTLSIPDGNTLPNISHNPIISGEDAILDVQVTPNKPHAKLVAGTPVDLYDNGQWVDEAGIDYKGFVEFREPELTTSDLGHHHFQAVFNPDNIVRANLAFPPNNVIGPNDPNFHQAVSNFQDVVVNRGDVTITLHSDVNPQRIGQPVTLSVHVAGKDPTKYPFDPEGQVQLFVNGTPFNGPLPLDPSGDASLTTSDLPLGPVDNPLTITATYEGDDHYNGATVDMLQEIDPQLTAIDLSASVDPNIQYAQNETLTAHVTAESIAAHGTVTFLDNGNPILDSHGVQVAKDIVVDANGDAKFASRAFAIGQHQFSAFFTGDDSSQSGASNTLAIKVIPNTVRVAISTDRMPAYTGDKILVHARVLALGTSKGTITGALQYYDGAKKLGGQIPVAGSNWATKSILAKSLKAGKHRLVAKFVPSADPSYQLKVYSGATSDQLIQIRTTGKANAKIAAKAKRTSLSTAAVVVHVVKKSGAHASGYVRIYLDGVPVKTVHLDSHGWATAHLTGVSDRELAVTAAYLGSGKTKKVSVGTFLYRF
jgi:co-chaperonin GroES (HSP10)